MLCRVRRWNPIAAALHSLPPLSQLSLDSLAAVLGTSTLYSSSHADHSLTALPLLTRILVAGSGHPRAPLSVQSVSVPQACRLLEPPGRLLHSVSSPSPPLSRATLHSLDTATHTLTMSTDSAAASQAASTVGSAASTSTQPSNSNSTSNADGTHTTTNNNSTTPAPATNNDTTTCK